MGSRSSRRAVKAGSKLSFIKQLGSRLRTNDRSLGYHKIVFVEDYGWIIKQKLSSGKYKYLSLLEMNEILNDPPGLIKAAYTDIYEISKHGKFVLDIGIDSIKFVMTYSSTPKIIKDTEELLELIPNLALLKNWKAVCEEFKMYWPER